MAIVLVEDQGVFRLELPEALSPDEAREVRILDGKGETLAELAGLRAPISLEQTERLIAAGAMDHRSGPDTSPSTLT